MSAPTRVSPARAALPGLAALLVLPACVCRPAQPAPRAPPPPVVLMTDFGLDNDAVGLLRGVMLSIDGGLAIHDLTHRAPAFDVAAASRLLRDAPRYYPPGTVFVVVVDPGVGTDRRVLVARLDNGTRLVAPDNGVLSAVLEDHPGAVVRALANDDFVLETRSATFHGRDVFAPLGAHLASGVPFASVGPVVGDWLRLAAAGPTRTGAGYAAECTLIDEPFGNVWTDLEEHHLAELGLALGDLVTVQLADGAPARELTVPWVRTFADVAPGAPLLYIHSRERVALALNRGDFARTHGVERGDRLLLAKAPGD